MMLLSNKITDKHRRKHTLFDGGIKGLSHGFKMEQDNLEALVTNVKNISPVEQIIETDEGDDYWHLHSVPR